MPDGAVLFRESFLKKSIVIFHWVIWSSQFRKLKECLEVQKEGISNNAFYYL